MIISGLQKLTLLDYPGKTACTVFTHGCNFRCPFCHNAPLVTDRPMGEISADDFFSFLNKRRGLLDGVCISGGEPLLNDDIFNFAAQIKSMGFSVKLDTNGSFPDRLRRIAESGSVDYVAMDVKNSFDKYAQTAGCDLVLTDKIAQSIEFLINGTIEYEFRTTVVRQLHTKDDLAKIAETLRGAKRYFLQSFVDSPNLICGSMSGYEPDEMVNLLAGVRNILPVAELRGI